MAGTDTGQSDCHTEGRMAFLVRIEDCRTNRVWWEIRETEDEIDALVCSIESNHGPEWNHLICYNELCDEGPGWLVTNSYETSIANNKCR